MAGFEEEIHELLKDINGDYGKPSRQQPQQLSLPYSRHPSSLYQPHTDQCINPRNLAPPYDQQPRYPTDVSSPSIPQLYAGYADPELDDYDRALLAEQQPQGYWQTSSRMNTVPGPRLSLPNLTASAAAKKPSKQGQSRPNQRVPPSSQDSRSQLSRYIHSPTAQLETASSSPSNALPSSPSFAVKRHLAKPNHDCPNPSSELPHSANVLSFIPYKKTPAENKPAKRSNEQTLPQLPSFYSSSPEISRLQSHVDLGHAPPIVQGIQLVSLNELPDRLRSVFHHPLFNAIQSQCFPVAYTSNDNLVVSAPTGGGKTAILEMAICRLVGGFKTDQYKIVYMAPTKSLCSERQRDWQAKFATLGLQCAELTGDTEHRQLRSVQSASIIITTPEKWDSMTRKWEDNARLMQMVKLFLIDEVQILKESRGAILEAVISRMKSTGSDVRFVALSATVPNSEDIATWLGKNATTQHLPAPRERFGEEFRPVKLQKHVVGFPYKGSDFGFESLCDPKMPEIIARYSHKKPIMVFCITRKSAMSTAKLLANVWATKSPRDRHWEGPTERLVVQDPELKQTLTSGVAFHHAGVDSTDRHTVEKGFLEGQINVICCTSTLAVGVNLPCHMVIIKNTVSYQEDGLKEYSDLEIMQMLGRAGRPQFDTSAVAVIITKQEKVKKYEKLVSGEEHLESCLHLNLIDHLNAEIGLGTIYDFCTAKRWLSGTFLYVRLRQNPNHYKLDGDERGRILEDRIEQICRRDLEMLEETQLITSAPDGKLKSTASGDAMARHYVKFETMRIFMGLQSQSKMSDILSAVVQAEEFHDVRLRAFEKKLFKEINRANGIKFPIKVDLAQHAHKRSLILQAELGSVEYPTDEAFGKHKKQYLQDKNVLFFGARRLIRCIIDCQIHLKDAVGARHALELARSFSAQVWDNSPYQMKQIAQIGVVAIRKLAVGGINSIEVLEAAEPHRIEMLMSKNPPFGQKMLANLKEFPKLRVSIKMMGKETPKGRPVRIKIKAEIGFMNDFAPTNFHRKPIYVCLLTERSDGHMVDFRRTSAVKLKNGQDVLMTAELLNHAQYITCYVMCDEIAGTQRHAELKPDLPTFLFPPQPQLALQQRSSNVQLSGKHSVNQGGDTRKVTTQTSSVTVEGDEYGDDNLDDQDLVNAAEEADFTRIDDFDQELPPRKKTLKDYMRPDIEQTAWNPEKLDNGKWACNHKCKDKTACKHMCCREGIDKAPKPPKNAFVPASTLVESSSLLKSNHSTEFVPANQDTKRRAAPQCDYIETVDLANLRAPRVRSPPSQLRKLDNLHNSIHKGRSTPVLVKKRSSTHYTRGYQPQLSCLSPPPAMETSDRPSTDYDDDWMGSLPSPSTLLGRSLVTSATTDEKPTGYRCPPSSSSARLGEDDFMTGVFAEAMPENEALGSTDPSQPNEDDADVEEAMIGLSDSVVLKEGGQANEAGLSEHSTTDQMMSSNPALAPNKAENLFLTSSSEQLAINSQKRAADLDFDTENYHLTAPVPKKLKLSEKSDQALQRSSQAENKAAPPLPVIKPGQPAWVYEFDPAFIAEYQDFVNFI